LARPIFIVEGYHFAVLPCVFSISFGIEEGIIFANENPAFEAKGFNKTF
jgi:hypothetical protein